MKKISKLLSIILAVIMVAGCLPLGASAVEAKAAPVSYLLNDASDADTYSYSNAKPEIVTDGYGISPDGKYMAHAFLNTENGGQNAWNDWIVWNMTLDTAVYGGSVSNITGFAFWVDFSEATEDIRWDFDLKNDNDETLGVFGSSSDTSRLAYLVNTKTGVAQEINCSSGYYGGFSIPAGFVGYFIVPTDGENAATADYSLGTKLSFVRRFDKVLGDETCHASYRTDSVTALTNISEFINNIKTGVAGTLTKSTLCVAEGIDAAKDGKKLVWSNVEAASTYQIRMYTMNSGRVTLAQTLNTTDTSILYSALPAGSYAVQIVALDANGELVADAASNVVILNSDWTDSNFELVNSMASGTYTSDYTQTSVENTFTPDGNGLKVVTEKSKTITFNIAQTDLSAYDGVAFYVKMPAEGLTYSFNNLTADGTTITKVIKDSQGYVYGNFKLINLDGTVVNGDTADYEDNYFHIWPGFEGYVVFELVDFTEALNVSSISFSSCPWHYSNQNDGSDLYVDNLYLVKDFDRFTGETTAFELGYIPTSNTVSPQFVIDGSTATVTYDAVAGATNYLVNIYDNQGNLFDSVLSTDTSVVIEGLALGRRYSTQVVAFGANGIISALKVAVEFSGGQPFVVLNDFSDKSTTFGDNLERDGFGNKIPTTNSISFCMWGWTYVNAYFSQNADAAGVDGFAVWVDTTMYEVSGNPFNMYVYDSAEVATKLIGTEANQSVYFVDAITGQITKSTVSNITGIYLPPNFRGYVVFEAHGDFTGDISDYSYFSMRRCGYIDFQLNSNDESEGGGTRSIEFDSLLAITNFEKFENNIIGSLALAGAFTPTGSYSKPKINVVQNDTIDINVYFDAVDTADKYIVSVYDNDNARSIVESKAVTQTEVTFDSMVNGKNYAVQVIAMSNGVVLANSEIVTFKCVPGCLHDYVDINTTASCTEYGYVGKECTVCGHSDLTVTGNPLGHNFVYSGTTTTCDKLGVCIYRCTRCETYYTEADTVAVEHNYLATAQVESTCQSLGYTVYSCTNCSDSYNETHGDYSPHNYITSKVPSTCEKAGSFSGVCVDCGASFANEYPKLAHTYGEWTITTTATASASGVKSRTCSVCGYVQTKAYSLTDTTVTVYDEMAYGGQTVTVYVSIDENNGFTAMRLKLGYNTDYLTLTSIEDMGILGDSYHTDVYDGDVYLYWMDINNEMTDTGVVAALTFEVADNAPAGEYIISLTYNSSDVFDSDLEPVSLDITDGILYVTEACKHENVERINMSDATCGTDGSWEDICFDCGETVATGTIPATGLHEFGDGIVVIAPTCAETGLTVYVCEVCGEEKDEEVAATSDHDYVDDQIITAATCVTAGLKSCVCSVCGDTCEVEIPATGKHTYETEVIAATPEAQGYTKYTCSVCGDTYNDNFVDYVPEGTTTPASDFTYTVGDTSVTITKYNGTAKEVIIPSTIEGKPVTAIGSKAFYTNRTLKSVTLPATLKTIGTDAFRGCTALTEVVFNEGLEKIGTYAFGLTKITEFVAPSTLTTIGVSAFNGCTALGQIDLANVKYIKGSAFAGCTALGSTAAGVRIVVPATVTEVGAHAFLNCTSIKRVDWYPVKLTSGAAGSMENPAFKGCTTINEARIYETAVNVPTYLFYKSSNVANNLGISTLSFRGTSSAQTIGDYAFYQQRIGKVTFPNTITKIGVESFRNNNMLKTLTFGTGEQTIGQLAFSFCNNLPSVTIPGNVKTIYAYAFRGCAKLETVVVEEGVDYISSYAFGFTALTSITLPGSITRINSGLTYPTSATIYYPAGTYVDTYLHSSAARITNETLVPIA